MNSLTLRGLDGAGYAESGSLIQMRGENLHADGKAGRGCAAGYSDAANAGETGGNSVDVGKIHGEGVACLLAELEGGRGRGGGDDSVDLSEGAEELLGEQAADLLGLAVVGVVIAGGEGVSAKQNAALDLGAEAFVAGVAVHGRERVGRRRAVAVADAVEAGQVGAGFCGGDEVVDGDGVPGGGKRNGLDGAAGGLEGGDAGLDGGADFRVEAFGEVLGGDADAQAGDGLVALGGVVGHEERWSWWRLWGRSRR